MDHCNEYKEYVELISAAIDGALTTEETARLEEHLNSCPECKALYDDLNRVHQALLELPPVEVPAGLTDRILDAVAADNITALPKAKKSAFRPWRSLAAAAVLALVLAGAWSTFQGHSQPTKSEPPERMARGAMAPVEPSSEDEDAVSTYSVYGAMKESTEAAPAPDLAQAPAAGQNTAPADRPTEVASDTQNTDTMTVDISAITEEVTDPEAAAYVIPGALFVMPVPEDTDMELPAENAPGEQNEEPGFTQAEALALVVERCFGDSGYEMVRENPGDDSLSCHISLMDQDTFVAGGTIVYTGEIEEFFLFECHWDDDPEEPYHYSVHKTEGYVAWQGEVLGNEP